MSALNQNVRLEAGDTFEISFPVLNPDGTDAVLTGAVVRWWVAASAFSAESDVILKKASGGSGITIAGNMCTVHGAAGDIPNSAAGDAYHEAKVFFLDGRIKTALSGKLVISATLIRPT